VTTTDEPFEGTVVTICTTCFSNKSLCFVHTVFIQHVFRMVLAINSDCFPKQHLAVGIYNNKSAGFNVITALSMKRSTDISG
jgi:hypothetical protein